MPRPMPPTLPARRAGALLAALVMAWGPAAAGSACERQTGERVTPVVELYTSQGCSSCPPADRWLSSLRPGAMADGDAVIQAFHVAYWDYIGWADPFATAAHTARQRQVAAWNGLRSLYTPQVVLGGRDWRQWRNSRDAPLPVADGPARALIGIARRAPDQFTAAVTVRPGAPPAWGAYWTVTDSGHTTKVHAGENTGTMLRNDHVVRQYTMAGRYRSTPGVAQALELHAVAAPPGRDRTVNLVVFDPRNGHTLQAVSLTCR